MKILFSELVCANEGCEKTVADSDMYKISVYGIPLFVICEKCYRLADKGLIKIEPMPVASLISLN